MARYASLNQTCNLSSAHAAKVANLYWQLLEAQEKFPTILMSYQMLKMSYHPMRVMRALREIQPCSGNYSTVQDFQGITSMIRHFQCKSRSFIRRGQLTHIYLRSF